jgi:hypothetical protein
MVSRISSCFAGVLLCLAASALPAQRATAPIPGDQVRLSLPGARQEGRYLSGFGSTVVIVRPDGDTIRVPMGQVRKAWVVEGKRRRFVHDMLLGAGIGAAVGIVAGIPMMGGQTISDPAGFLVWTGSIVGTLGAATGLVVAINPRTHWRRVWPPEP